MNMTDKKLGFFIGLIIGVSILLTFGAAVNRGLLAPASSTDNAIIRFNGTSGFNSQNSGVIINDTNGVSGIADLVINGSMTTESFNTDTMTVLSNLFLTLDPYDSGWGASSNAAAQKDVYDQMELRATKANASFTGTTTFGGPVAFTQIELQPHDSVTNFVMDPTTGTYQIINATNWVVKFLHATNIAAGRQAVFIVKAGTNATVSVEIPTTGLEWTNKVSIAAGQGIAVSLYGDGSNNTNTWITFGRMME